VSARQAVTLAGAARSDGWTPKAGQTAYLRTTGQVVKVMDFHAGRVYVRPLRGGTELALKVSDLIPPDDQPGGFNAWSVSRG